MKVFISLPSSARAEQESRERADLVKASLSRSGHRAVSPYDIFSGRDAGDADRLCDRLRTLSQCDALYLCEGWRENRDCRIEANFAKEFGKRLMYETRSDNGTEYYFNR